MLMPCSRNLFPPSLIRFETGRPSWIRQGQDIDIRKCCPFPLCMLAGNFRIHFNFSILFMFLLWSSCAIGTAASGSTSSQFFMPPPLEGCFFSALQKGQWKGATTSFRPSPISPVLLNLALPASVPRRMQGQDPKTPKLSNSATTKRGRQEGDGKKTPYVFFVPPLFCQRIPAF